MSGGLSYRNVIIITARQICVGAFIFQVNHCSCLCDLTSHSFG